MILLHEFLLVEVGNTRTNRRDKQDAKAVRYEHAVKVKRGTKMIIGRRFRHVIRNILIQQLLNKMLDHI